MVSDSRRIATNPKPCGDAGWDMTAADNLVLEPGQYGRVGTGIALRGPPGTYIRLADRSSIAHQRQLHALAWVIDRGFNGGVMVNVIIPSKKQQTIQRGDRICQAIVTQLGCLLGELSYWTSKAALIIRNIGQSILVVSLSKYYLENRFMVILFYVRCLWL